MFKRQFCLALIVVGALIVACPASAERIIGTGFENEIAYGTHFTNYDHSGSIGNIQQLDNGPDQTLIESTSASTAAGDLGFTAEFDRTFMPGAIFTDFHEFEDPTQCVGIVVDMLVNESPIGNSFSGSSDSSSLQGYKASDLGGTLRLTFDEVDLSSYTDVTVSLDAYLRDATWEWDLATQLDYLNAYMLTNEGNVSIMDTRGYDIDNMGIEGFWLNGLSANLSNTVTSAQLVIEFSSDSDYEQAYFDNIVFDGTFNDVPVPGAVWLFGSGIIGLFGLRRKNKK